jgi:streptomycin 6-kinase
MSAEEEICGADLLIFGSGSGAPVVLRSDQEGLALDKKSAKVSIDYLTQIQPNLRVSRNLIGRASQIRRPHLGNYSDSLS